MAARDPSARRTPRLSVAAAGLLLVLVAPPARAEEQRVEATETATLAAEAEGDAGAEVDAEPTEVTESEVGLSDDTAATEDVAVIEDVVVSERRLSERSRPDTQLRLTGKQIIERGATNLAQAIDMIADANVRAAGRGGYQVNIRGARKGGVLILIDGVPMSDVYNGNFDLTSIPATDVAEIRLALTPASPLDGPGGNGGVIEVLTRSAHGKAEMRGQAVASNVPGGTIALTGRATTPGDLAVRLSVTGGMANRNFAVTTPERFNSDLREDARSGAGNLRLERNFGRSRLRLDAGAARRRFIVPPVSEDTTEVLQVEREDLFRGVLAFESLIGRSTLSAKAFSLLLDRTATRWMNASLLEQRGRETLFAHRTGGNVQLDLPLGEELRLTAVTHLQVEGGASTLTNRLNTLESQGTIAVTSPALGLTWAATSWLSLDATAGVAVPLGIGADAWPEAKVWLTATPISNLQLRVTGARKGRAPVVRERYEIGTGNPTLAPEMGTSAEADLQYSPVEWARITGSVYYRFTEDLIRLNDNRSQLTNVGDVTVSGFESGLSFYPHRLVSAGVAYQYARAVSDDLGRDPLDFFPNHRGELWLSTRLDDDLGLWGRARYTGERWDNGTELYGYVTLDAAFFARVDGVQISVRGENVLDQDYQLRLGVPGFGRTLYLGLETRFD